MATRFIRRAKFTRRIILSSRKRFARRTYIRRNLMATRFIRRAKFTRRIIMRRVYYFCATIIISSSRNVWRHNSTFNSSCVCFVFFGKVLYSSLFMLCIFWTGFVFLHQNQAKLIIKKYCDRIYRFD